MEFGKWNLNFPLRIGWCLMWLLAAGAALAAEKEAPVFEIDFSKATYAPVPEASLAGWKSQGWKIQTKELLSSWVPTGSDGFLTVLKEPNGGRFLRFKGQLRGPTIPMPSSGWLVAQVTLRNGSVAVDGLKTPSFEAGPQWAEPAFVCQLKGSFGLNLYAPNGPVDVRGIKVIPATGALDAYRKAYPLVRQSMVNVVKNGGFEETKVCLPEDLRKWRDDQQWDLGEGDRIMLPEGFGAHPSYNGKRLRVIDDPAQSHSGSRCVEFTLMAGGVFTAKPDKVYLFSLWARGNGKLDLSANGYGGPDGGFIGNFAITPPGGFGPGDQWENFQATTSFKKEDYSTIGISTVFGANDGVCVDDFTVFELDTGESLLEKISKVQASLKEAVSDQVQLGPRQREMLKFLTDEAEKLRARCTAGNDAGNLEELANRVEALGYVTAGVKSEMEFGSVQE